MQYSTQWTIGYTTQHPQALQNMLNAGEDYTLALKGPEKELPKGKFVVTAYLPQDAEADNTGIYVVAEKHNFRAYIAKPESVAKIMQAMEFTDNGKVRMQVRLDGPNIIFLGAAPEPFGLNPFNRKTAPKI